MYERGQDPDYEPEEEEEEEEEYPQYLLREGSTDGYYSEEEAEEATARQEEAEERASERAGAEEEQIEEAVDLVTDGDETEPDEAPPQPPSAREKEAIKIQQTRWTKSLGKRLANDKKAQYRVEKKARLEFERGKVKCDFLAKTGPYAGYLCSEDRMDGSRWCKKHRRAQDLKAKAQEAKAREEFVKKVFENRASLPQNLQQEMAKLKR